MGPMRDRITVYEQRENDPWATQDSDLYTALTEPINKSSTRLIFTSSTPLEGHIPIAFPEGFSSIINEDLNGSFFCDYISSEDDDDNIVRHVSWTCFKVKMVLKPNVYEWVQTALLIDWTAFTDSQTVLVLNLPKKQQLQMQRKLSQIKTRLNPFQWHMQFTSTLITLYDESIWSLRDLVRGIEKSRDKPNPPPPNFPHLHDIGRHIFHSTETLEVAENTVANIVAEQARWRDEFPESRQNGRGVYLHTQQRLYSLSKQLHSLKTRSRSLTERLNNENNSASASSLLIYLAHEEDIEFQHANKVSGAMFQDHRSQISANTINPGSRFIASAPVNKTRIKSSSDISDETNLNDEKWQNIISSRWRKNECFNCGYASHYEDECYLKCGKCLMNDHTQRHCPKLIKHFSDEQWNTVLGHRWRKNECLNCGYASHYEDRCYLKCGRCLTGGHTQRNCRERISQANSDFTAEMTEVERLHGVNLARTDLSPANASGDWTRQQDNAAYDAHTSRNPSSFNLPGGVANDRQPLPGSADFEYSESSSENNSVFSTPFSVSSTASLESGRDGINLFLIQEFANLFHEDNILLSLILDGITKPWIGFETMLKNFRRFLIHFANQLKTEVLSDWHQNVSSFVRSSSTQITRALFAMVFIDKEHSINPQIVSVKNRHTKRKVEDYLKSLYGGHHAFRSDGLIEEFNNDQEESDEDSVLDEAGEVEPYEGSLQHLDQTKHLISESAAYQTLLCQLEGFIWPSLHSRLRDLLRRWSNPQNKNYSDVVRYSLRDLVAELQYMNPYDIIFDHDDETSRFVWYTSYYQHLVEHWTGERWDWWPLPRCLRPLGESETRLRWKCSCGEERWKEVPKTFTKRLQSIIKDIAMNTAGNPNIQPPPAAHVKSTSPRNASSSSQSSNQKLRTDNKLQKDSPSSSPSVHHESMWLKANGPNMSLAQHRVLFLAKQGEDYKLAQIRVDNLGCDTFFDTLKKEYFRLRGVLRGHFSVWRYSHCDFYKFEKFDDHEFTPITKDAFPDQTNTDYEYRPKPMDNIPPISKHEFAKRFYACHKPRPLLHIHHRCRKLGIHSSDVLHFLPKKKTELEEAGFKREEFWGIYAREIISLRWIILYNFFCVSPLLLFFVAWTVPRGHDTDLQSPSIPLSLMGSMLSLFWSIFLSSLQFGKSN